jgi:hypothetical protein
MSDGKGNRRLKGRQFMKDPKGIQVMKQARMNGGNLPGRKRERLLHPLLLNQNECKFQHTPHSVLH